MIINDKITSSKWRLYVLFANRLEKGPVAQQVRPGPICKDDLMGPKQQMQKKKLRKYRTKHVSDPFIWVCEMLVVFSLFKYSHTSSFLIYYNSKQQVRLEKHDQISVFD